MKKVLVLTLALLLLMLAGQERGKEFLDVGFGRGFHNLPDGLPLPVQPQRGNASDILPLADPVKLIHVDLDDLHDVCVCIGDLVIGLLDPAAITAPGGPEVHQQERLGLDQLV